VWVPYLCERVGGVPVSPECELSGWLMLVTLHGVPFCGPLWDASPQCLSVSWAHWRYLHLPLLPARWWIRPPPPGTEETMSSLRVWIDQDLCTGDGLCAEICSAVFEMHDDGLAYVKEADWPNRYGPDGTGNGEPALQMAAGTAAVPDNLIDDVIESADACPGECIFIDVAE
jgi:ferredoxin